MEMHEIRYFLAACQTMNFHRAAEIAHVTQPALTRAIHKLETDLGGNLFLRERNHVQLTEFGRLMRAHLGEVYQRAETARSTAQSFLRAEQAPVTLGVLCTVGPMRLVGFLSELRRSHPEIAVTVVETPAGDLTDRLLTGRVDLAVMAQPHPFDGRLRVAPMYRERFGLAFAPGHRFEDRDRLHLSDVAGEAYLDRVNCEYGEHIDDLCRTRGIDIRVAYRSEREDWILAMVAAGLGVCFMPEFSAGHPGVCHRAVEDPAVVREVSLVSAAAREPTPAMLLFADALRAHRWDGSVDR